MPCKKSIRRPGKSLVRRSGKRQEARIDQISYAPAPDHPARGHFCFEGKKVIKDSANGSHVHDTVWADAPGGPPGSVVAHCSFYLARPIGEEAGASPEGTPRARNGELAAPSALTERGINTANPLSVCRDDVASASSPPAGASQVVRSMNNRSFPGGIIHFQLPIYELSKQR